MSLYTNFLKLIKPEETEKYNINVFNGNADLIDSALSILDQKDKSQDELLATKDSLNTHINNKNNPHEMTKSQIGLGKVENTSDSEKPVSTAQREAINDIYTQANSYTDTKIAELINGTPPTVKETTFVTNNGDLIVEGRKGNDYTNISDIFIKSNTYKEGMIIGISSNRMGYIVAQNFSIDCTKLTDDERILIQSFDSIKFRKLNNSNDFPILKPSISDHEVGFTVRGKNGWIRSTTKMQIGSNSSENYFTYMLPNEFKNDDNSSNNLSFVTSEWTTLTGINIRNAAFPN